MAIGIGLILFSVSAAHSQEARNLSVTIGRLADATHLELKGAKKWDYELKPIAPGKIQLQVSGLSQESLEKLGAYKDELIEKIEIERNPESRDKIVIHMKTAQIESFDYLTDDPSRLIIDLFQTEAPKVAKSIGKKPEPLSATEKPKMQLPDTKTQVAVRESSSGYEKKKVARDPAGEILDAIPGQEESLVSSAKGLPKLGVFDGGDPNYERFRIRDYEIREEAIIASKQNIYIRFPMLRMDPSQLKELAKNPPEFEIKEQEDKENKEARLLLTLFKNKRYAGFLKTYEYFTRTYPESRYDEIIRNMAADVYFRLWERDSNANFLKKSIDFYRQVLQKYPKSPLSERNHLFVGYSEMEQGDGIETIQTFQQFLKNYPQSEFRDQAKKCLAEGFLKLSQFGEALKVYEDLTQTAQNKDNAVEALYRIGDVFFSQKDYVKALETYQSAVQKFPEYENKIPNANYNIAESYFWSGEYRKALDFYIRFQKLFPAHDHGSYALTRVGELLEILGADKTRVMGAFLESHFRFKNAPGAEVARVRMLSQRMSVMKEKEMKSALEELEVISKNSKLPRIEEFVTLMNADGLYRRGQFDQALQFLISYYQKNPTSTNLEFFKKRIHRNISEEIRLQLDRDNFIQALSIYGKYGNTWLRNSNRIDIPYFLARAYEQAGVPGEAIKIYSKVKDSLSAIQGTQEEKERRVNEHLPSVASVNLRLGKVMFEQREFAKVQKLLSELTTQSVLTDEENIERIELAAKVAVERGEPDNAKRFLMDLIKTWNGQPQLLIGPHFTLAQMYMQTLDYDRALKEVESVESLRKANAKIPTEKWFKTLEMKGDILLAQKKPVAATEAFLALADQFEGKSPVDPIRYKAGRILFDNGDVKGAERIWSQIKDNNRNVYSELAKEKLKDSQWQEEYQKYMKRIPAMNEFTSRTQ